MCGAIAVFSMLAAGILKELKIPGWSFVYVIAIPAIMYLWNKKQS
jgi:hypothetical protein